MNNDSAAPLRPRRSSRISGFRRLSTAARRQQLVVPFAASTGLASSPAALKALSTEGVQHGHLSLHARRVAVEAGTTGTQVALVAARLACEKSYRPERARQLMGAAR